jgi:hypothetical protein
LVYLRAIFANRYYLKKNCFLAVILLLPCAGCFAQDIFKVHGSVFDSESDNPLWGANVFIQELARGVIVDEKGYYEIEVPQGSYEITFSFVGYENQKIDLTVDRPQTLNVHLKPLASVIDEVVILDRRLEDKITETETGRITLTKKELETLPYLLGEIDPVRIIQLMPGVHTAGEGNTGFYVRGGAVDQNLMVLDHSIVYNPSHLFGFFSVFNGSTISSLDLYKGGIPAYYGGRLSSITNINTRRGDTEKIKGEAGIGLISANLLLEGPIKKGKGSFLVAGRRTYIDLLMDPLRQLFSVVEKLDYYFYDLNINADYKLGPKDHVSFRAYNGKDDFKFGTGSSFTNTIRWGNTTASLNWVHQFSDNLFSELSLNSVFYDMRFGAGVNNYIFHIFSDIRDHGFTYQLDLKKGKHSVAFGLSYTYHTLTPNNMETTTQNAALEFNSNMKLHADEATAFINDKILLSDKIELNAGVRFTAYSQLGAFTRYTVDDNLQLLDTIVYGRNKRIATYANAEPRLSLRYSLNSSSSIKASYDKAYQYMHMAPLASASLPMDVWVTSSTIVKPQSSDQFSAGYFRNFSRHAIESSLVVYYKTMRNQMEYRDGVIIGYSKGFNFDDNFVFGKGISYGAEILIRKSSGTVNGMIAYTLARTTREFKDLNRGKAFPAKYDRLHDVSVMTNYVANPRWTFSGVFVYGTGNALNLPVARYVIQGNIVNEYGSRNSFRMPPYHRLDLAATYVSRKSKKIESAWIFSIYNVYNRRNPYYIYFESTGDLQEYKLETSLKQVSLFPVLPSVTYRLKF